MSDDVRHLGTIEGREIQGNGGPAVPPEPSPGPGPAPAPAPPGPPPSGPSDAHPVTSPGTPGQGLVVHAGSDPVRPRRTAAVRAEVAGALHDIRDAHRRGPKQNSRPLPQWVRRMAWVLDDAVEIPATGGRRVGIDGFITIIPGIGDAIGIALSMVVVTAGVLAGVSWPTIIRMMWNVAFEGVVGLIPFAGVAFDMAYKANDRNVRLIERDLADRKATRRSSIGILLALVATTIAGFVLMFLLGMLGIAVMVWIIWRLVG